MPEGRRIPKRARNTIDIPVDRWFLYPSLRNYYGPSSIIDVLRLERIVSGAPAGTRFRLVSGESSARRTNAAFLVGAYLLWWGGLEVEHVISMLSRVTVGLPAYQTEGEEPFPDTLSVADCLRAMDTFRRLGLVNPENLDPEEIAFWEDPDNGDMNWIVPGQFLAFAGPDHENLESFISYAQDNNIRAVIRLNEHVYEPLRLEAAGIGHLDLPMEDGHVPSLEQIVRFRQYVEPILRAGGAVAVHCRAGLGRTGTMIGTYLVREYGLQVEQVIAWARIMRPGCFLTKQPRFMEAIQWWLRDEEPTAMQRAFIDTTVGDEMHAELQQPFSSYYQ